MVSRTERTPFADWWWTVDRLLLAALLALMLGGIVLSLAASPPVAARLGLEPFHFVNRHVLYLVPALAVLLATSFLPPRHIRRLALVVFVDQPCAGRRDARLRRRDQGRAALDRPARRQHPAVGIPQAGLRDPDRLAVRANPRAGRKCRRTPLALALLLRRVTGARAAARFRPDHADRAGLGRAVLHRRACGSIWVAGLGGAAAVGLVARLFAPFRTWRGASSASSIPASGDTFKIDQALESFLRGGWFGRGPGEGTVKRILPDSHTDFVFAVAAEEFGIVLCLLLVALFAFIVLRALRHAMRNEDPFARFAAAGLAILFGLQSAINMAVNLHLMPAKGMTLPFISYGGSSMISLAYGMGMLLALTRERPRAEIARACQRRIRAAPGAPA